MTRKLKYLLCICLCPLYIFGGDPSDVLYDESQVASVYITIPSDSLDWLYQHDNLENDEYIKGTMRYVISNMDTTLEDIGFRLRGNTSRYSQKKSFKVSFNEFVPGRRFFGLKKFNLNGEHNDPSIARARLSWELFEDINVKASRCAHARVYINSEYYGLYINVEHYDDIFLESRFGTSAGNFYKCLWPASLSYISSNPDDYKFENSGRRAYELKTNEDEDDYTDIADFINILNNTPDDSFADSVFACFDVWNYLKIQAMTVLTGMWDDYWFNQNNYYLYNNPKFGKFEFIPYDFDNTFGISWGDDWTSRNIYTWGNTNISDRPLTNRILAVEEYKNIYSWFLNYFMDEYFNNSRLDSQIDAIETQISEAAEADLYRTYDYGYSVEDFHNSFNIFNRDHARYGIKDYINYRVIFAKSQVSVKNLKPTFMNSPKISFPEPGRLQVIVNIFDESMPDSVQIHIKSTSGTDIHTLDLSQSLFDGTIPYYQYIATIDIGGQETVEYYLAAYDESGNRGTLPFNAPGSFLKVTVPASSSFSLCINEFMADNDNVIADDFGEYDDWLEVYNAGYSAINLSGYYLTDNPQELAKWPFPDTTILPNDFLLVWVDDDEEDQGPMHASFKLGKDGEYAAITQIVGGNTIIIDSLFFGPQETDVSYGRTIDGSPEWAVLPNATPGYSNTPIAIDEEEISVIDQFILHQNYPNPFNPETTISFELPQSSDIKLTIYDISGKQVDELVNRRLSAGSHSVKWNASANSSGVYFYRLSSDGSTEIRKCLLVK